MFERYTEPARRVIFFARYEASQFGSTTIESEHLLLGLIREDKPVLELLSDPESVRIMPREIAEHLAVKEKVSTSIDLPLSNECKRILAYAAEEAERLKHRDIGVGHLLLGILREEKCEAVKILQRHGCDLTTSREALAKKLVEPGSPGSHPVDLSRMLSAAPVLQVTNLKRSIEWYRHVLRFDAQSFLNPVDPIFAILSKHGVEIMLQKTVHEDPSTKAGAVWDAYIRVRDIRAFRTSIQSKLDAEISIRETEYGCSEFTLIDPDGHVLVFGECR